MNKNKLTQIIERDLDELKMLTEEVILAQDDATLIIDLAVSKAKLLCQEIELLREFSVPKTALPTDNEEELIDEEESEVSDFSVADPELEIINFEDREFPEEEEVTQNQEEDTEKSEEEPEEEQEEETPEDEELKEEDRAEEEESPEEEPVEEGDRSTGGDDGEEEAEEEMDQIEEQEDTPSDTSTGYTGLKTGPQPGVREIHIEDLDDGDIEPVKIPPQASPAERPAMHEIPKPGSPAQEPGVQEEQVMGEPLRKERSLNDVIGDNQPAETTLTHGPITSLRAAIGLNDRFLFIREIFSNNSDKYNMIIDHLDKLETIQEAVEYLKANLTLQKNETSMKFVDLLKRRFTK